MCPDRAHCACVCVFAKVCVRVRVCVLPMRVIVGLVLVPANSRHSERFLYIIGKEHVRLSNTLHTVERRERER